MSALKDKPRAAVVAVTLGCNSKCKTCDIWMIKPANEMQAADYLRLPPTLTHINVSGGEPFLRDDLPEIVGHMRQVAPSARIVLSTNGILPERIEGLMRDIPGAAVRVSIDGIGETHDHARGVKGNYDRCLETLDRLRSIGVDDLGISATASQYNPGAVTEVQQLAEQLGVQFVVGVAHSSPTYFGDQVGAAPDAQETARELEAIRNRELSKRSYKEWFRAYFTDGLIDQLEGKPRRMPCYAIEAHFYLDPHGNVYPCNARDDKLGNLLEETYSEIVAKNTAMLAEVQSCNACWMSCTVSPGMRVSPWKAIGWVARAKLLGARTRAPLAPEPGVAPGTGQGVIPIYLDDRGRERYATFKEVPSPGGGKVS